MLTSRPESSPVIARPLDDVFATKLTPNGLVHISCAELLADAVRLASTFGEHRYVLNLCQSRYAFCRAFIAAIIHGACTLLPQNHRLGTQASLIAAYPGSCVIHDGLDELSSECDVIDVRSFAKTDETFCGAIPHIPSDQLIAIAFTSGSTGEPKANLKYWRTFVDSSAINAAHMLCNLDLSKCHHMLATVPPQHMWGLETSVLFPMFYRVCVHDARPLFPKDIAQTLALLTEPRVIVSTPVHLRALVASGLALTKIERVLCATAPLSEELALSVEQKVQGTITEVYGCSEAGSMASREPVRHRYWRRFDGLHFEQKQGRCYEVHASHLPVSAQLSDMIHFKDDFEFELLGRDNDMLEIAGKRGSLQAMNHMLLALEGVCDGVVFVPEGQKTQVKRTAALVVCDGRQSIESIQKSLNLKLDSVFIPRPIKFVDALPRESNGKLQSARLNAFFKLLKD